MYLGNLTDIIIIIFIFITTLSIMTINHYHHKTCPF